LSLHPQNRSNQKERQHTACMVDYILLGQRKQEWHSVQPCDHTVTALCRMFQWLLDIDYNIEERQISPPPRRAATFPSPFPPGTRPSKSWRWPRNAAPPAVIDHASRSLNHQLTNGL
jgi:hypothetical protein